MVKFIFMWLLIFIYKAHEVWRVDAAILNGSPEMSLILDKVVQIVITQKSTF